jgi:hypothetical protein
MSYSPTRREVLCPGRHSGRDRVILLAKDVRNKEGAMSRGEMYHKPKYGQNDPVWVERGAEQPLEGQVLRYIGGRTYEVAISGQGVRVIQEQALSLRTKGERR